MKKWTNFIVRLGGRPDTLVVNNRIEREALKSAGTNKIQINELVSNLLKNLQEQRGIKQTRIPWYSKWILRRDKNE